MEQKNHDRKISILAVLISGSLWVHFFVLDALPYVCMIQCVRPAVFVWLCKLHRIKDHGTARGLRSFQTCTTTRMQLEGRNVPCKQYCASDFQHLICTEDVTAIRHTLQRLQIDDFSGHDCIFHVEQPPERVPTD